MPPFRKLPEEFEEVEGQRDKILCRVCTERGFGPVTILRTSKSGHIKSNVHQRAVGELQAQRPVEQEHRNRDAPPIEMPRYQTIASMLATPTPEPANGEHRSSESLIDHLWFEEDGQAFYNGDQVMFSAGTDPNAEHQRHLEHLKSSLTDIPTYRHSIYPNGASEEDFPDDEILDSTERMLRAALDAIGVEEDIPPDDQLGIDPFDMSVTSEEWAPYESKTMFMLDMLDSLPRLRLSDDHLRTVIWVMKECGTPNVPTFSRLRKVQEALKTEFKLDPEHHVSSTGCHFYMNHSIKLFSLDWSNPLIRPQMQLYPEINPVNGMSEMWHGEKWIKELTKNELTPMWCDFTKPGAKHYYVHEITEVDDGTFLLPRKWVIKDGAVHAEGWKLHYSGTERAFSFADPEVIFIPAMSLSRNIHDLRLLNEYNLQFSDITPREFRGAARPNPLRAKANNRPMFRIQVTVWSDDVSGNVSKQYNPHTNIYLQNLSLPHKNLSQEYFVRFSSTSSHASSSEQLAALIKDFDPETWHEAYDCELGEEILFQLVPHVLPADNPQQSEHASHIGSNGLYNCRRDKLGGTDEEKESDEGYAALFKVIPRLAKSGSEGANYQSQPGRSRQIYETVDSIKAQFRLACYGSKDLVQEAATQTGVKDKISQYWINILLAKAQEEQHKMLVNRSTRDPIFNTRMKKEDRSRMREQIKRNIQTKLYKWVVKQPPDSYEKLPQNDPARTDIRPGDHYSALLATPGIDPHQDTPVEILHTWLLGNTKYIWHHTNTQWDTKSERLFAVRLQASDVSGLTTPPPRANYLVQYKNSLIGKHFKILEQLAVFHLYGLCPDIVFDMWKAAGELGALLWFPAIKDLEEYLDDLQICIDNVLTIWVKIDPMKVITKIKLHLLAHLVDDIRRFGPAVLYSTEVFECWNHVFRLCSILSNHLAPSKDIADTLGGMERFKHVVSGGWWKTDNGFTQAGPSVRDMLKTDPELQRRLGWTDTTKLKAGSVKLKAQKKRQTSHWNNLGLPLELLPVNAAPQQSWDHCKHVISCSIDTCTEKTWIFFKNGDSVSPGRIVKILAKSNGSSASPGYAAVVIQGFSLLPDRHPKLDMPVITPCGQTMVVPPLDILFPFNAQHDCIRSACSVSDTEFVYQERKKTTISKSVIVHDSNPVYVINMHSLHNPHFLRQALPRSHSKPIAYCLSHDAERLKIAAELRILGPQKRAETREKAKATRARNKAKRSAAATKAATAAGTSPEHTGEGDVPQAGNDDSGDTAVNAEGSDADSDDSDDDPYAEEVFIRIMNPILHR